MSEDRFNFGCAMFIQKQVAEINSYKLPLCGKKVCSVHLVVAKSMAHFKSLEQCDIYDRTSRMGVS